MGRYHMLAKGGKVNGLQLTIGLLGVLFYGGGHRRFLLKFVRFFYVKK